jgi:hypothetical protein
MYYEGAWGIPEEGYSINGVGKMIACDNTNNGDGMATVTDYQGNKKFIGVDSGLVCIVQVSNVFKNPDKKFGVMTNNLEEAYEFYEQGLKI